MSPVKFIPVSIKIDRNPIDQITRTTLITVTFGNFQFDLQFGVLFMRWRYCPHCGDILETDGTCTEPKCKSRCE